MTLKLTWQQNLTGTYEKVLTVFMCPMFHYKYVNVIPGAAPDTVMYLNEDTDFGELSAYRW